MEDSFAFYMQAKILERMKLYSQAIDSYDKVLRLDKNFVNAAYSKAACESLIGRLDQSIESYRKALATDKVDSKGSKGNSFCKHLQSSPIYRA